MYKDLRFLIPGFILLAVSGCAEFSKSDSSKSVKDTGMSLGTLGAVEYVHVYPFEKPFEARIDTGAKSSSIDAFDIKPFERDGDRWVTFKVKNDLTGTVRSYELPLVKRVIIKSKETKLFKSDKLREHRYVVKMRIRIGKLDFVRNFTLANRTRFDYQVLVGRNIILGNAVVDVSKKHLQPTK
ncbi:RimK/LysX family protein [Lentisphaerota bacterium ZTH]|nr:ATP-dependent zinc protease [Lentisphaerota bacterium]WET06759.1 RimK/LysX family protein [Lentisphaerota bacterium ZTH]